LSTGITTRKIYFLDKTSSQM